jgi:hypothetical protein
MIVSAALLAMSLGAGAASGLPALKIALTLDPQLPPQVARLAVEEAAAIWRPYGVTVEASASSLPCPDPGAVISTLAVRIQPGRPNPGVRSAPFAAVRFFNGEPESTLLLYYEAITSLALGRAEVGGARVSDGPRSLRERMAARVVGRALAHEIGHWLLRSRAHSAAGLMRAAHPTSHMLAAHRRHFTLAPEDVARLGEAVRRVIR